MKRLQTYTAPGITVTFDPNLCLHAAACLRALPQVFDVSKRRWVAPENASVDEVCAAIDRCPTGALAYRRETSSAGEVIADPRPAAVTIVSVLNGPLLIEGSFEFYDEFGTPIPLPGRAALCRCGGSKNKPFCDNTHRLNGFRSRPAPAS